MWSTWCSMPDALVSMAASWYFATMRCALGSHLGTLCSKAAWRLRVRAKCISGFALLWAFALAIDCSFIPGLLFQFLFLGSWHSMQVLLLKSLSAMWPCLHGSPVKYLVSFCFIASCLEINFILILYTKKPNLVGWAFSFYYAWITSLLYRIRYGHHATRSRNAQLPYSAWSQSQNRLPYFFPLDDALRA